LIFYASASSELGSSAEGVGGCLPVAPAQVLRRLLLLLRLLLLYCCCCCCCCCCYRPLLLL
jgi:hypothetical protein